MADSVSKASILIFITFTILVGCGASGAFEKAKQQNTITSYEDFIRNYPDSEFSSEASQLLDKAWFEQAKHQHTKDAYQRYLKQFPQGHYVQDVQNLIEQWLFEQVQTLHTREVCDQYLEQYPRGKYVAEVNEIKETILIQFAREQKKPSPYLLYLKEFPQGKFLNEAMREMEELFYPGPVAMKHIAIIQIVPLTVHESPGYDSPTGSTINAAGEFDILAHQQEWTRLALPNNQSGWIPDRSLSFQKPSNLSESQSNELMRNALDYLKYFPEGKYVALMRLNLESALYAESLRVDTLQAVKTYLAQFPYGRFINDAILLQESLTWREAIQTNTLKGYQLFRQQYPNSPLALQALEKMAPLLALQIKESPQSLGVDQQMILDQQLEQATLKNSIESYQNFIDLFDGTSTAETARDRLFQKYEETPSIDGYLEFIERYPLSSHTGGAIESILKLYQVQNTVEGYDQFIQRHPQSRHVSQAIDRQFEVYHSGNTEEGYETFIKKFPYTPQAALATGLLLSLYEKEKDVEKFEKFVALYPASSHARKAISDIYAKVRNANIIAGYLNFLQKYPNVPEALDAVKQIHQIAMARAMRGGYSMMVEFQRAFPYADEYDTIDQNLSDLERVRLNTESQLTPPEETALVLMEEARQANRNKEYTVAMRKYSVLQDNPDLARTRTGKKIQTSGELQKARLSFQTNENRRIESLNRIHQLLDKEEKERMDGSISLSFRQGYIENIVKLHMGALYAARVQADERSKEASSAHQLMLYPATDQQECTRYGVWLCGNLY
ncbi:MAG: hypothetical protein HQM11_04800 [SAR324 cluster bacterium]|nr:hypothetical protein [SAR324 cluster bacterium]